MRTRHALLGFAALAGAAALAAQEPARSPEVLRSGVDLITVDVAALDGDGRPVADLEAGDFRATVDGRARPVVSAQLVTVDAGAPGETALPNAPLERGAIATNLTAGAGRRVVVAVDQTLITPGAITPLLRTAAGFVDGLAPADYAAFLAFPEPGPRVDFTTDKTRVAAALQGIIGQPAKMATSTFGLSLTEALEIANKERVVADPNGQPEEVWRSLGPWMRRVLERGCDGVSLQALLQIENAELLRRCVQDLGNESVLVALNARNEATISLRRLESYLGELAPIDGRKSLVLFSAGLLMEDLTLLDEVVRLAAAARTSITVIAVDPQRDQQETVGLPAAQGPTTLQDRSLELQGLETIADRTGGTFIRASGGRGEGIFERIGEELSAWYVLAVERAPDDPPRQRVDVEVRRRGVRLRANRTVVSTPAVDAQRPMEDVLRDALSSPIPVSGLPLRVATFTRRDADTGGVLFHVAAQIGQPGAPAGEVAAGTVLLDADQRTVITSRARRLTPPPDASAPHAFDAALPLEPGDYTLRLGAVDDSGRRGTIVRRVTVAAPDPAALETSDLIVGTVPHEGETMPPGVEPSIAGGRVAAYLELYPPADGAVGVSVRLEIAEGGRAPALATQQLNLGAGGRPDWRVASGAVDAGLLPGRYVARAIVRRGDEDVRVLTRPFVLEPYEPSEPINRVLGGTVPPDLQRRMAAYVASFVDGLANVVAEEQMVLVRPDRQVTSDFLLVRYPGSPRDLLTFRDVDAVDGETLPGRAERLTELFLKPVESIRQRVTEIALAAQDHVPPILNPLFALSFLQADFQSRFTLTLEDAGSSWPDGVRALRFVETARPTLLRAGPLGDLDVPSRGTAWIEPATGRVLQTELQIPNGRETTTIVTRFRLDDRLQIMVPELMRTQNPAGVATYRNYRRFTVRAESEVAEENR